MTSTRDASVAERRRQQLVQARRIVHVTLQPTEFDARVHRAVSTLRASGREVVVMAPGNGFAGGSMTLPRKLMIGFLFGAGSRLGLAAARAAFWALPDHRSALRAVIAARPDAIHAHDWDGLVIGARAARKLQVPLVYDAHEFATEMHLDRRLWRWTVRPLIARLESAEIPQADAVITVSAGIADCLRAAYRIDRPLVLVRNIPDLMPVPYAARPERGERVLLHYHGGFSAERGLIELVRAMALLPPRFHLRLTGVWRQRRLKRELLSEIARLDLTSRIQINAPVPFKSLVEHASEADIGIALFAGGSRNHQFALPNKFLEYIYAGLFVLSSNSNEIKRLMNELHCGLIVENCAAETIATALEPLSREQIDQGRAAARHAATALGWSNEADRLIDLYGGKQQVNPGPAVACLAAAHTL